ncbi:MAG: hypothetical protein ACXWWQ_00765 [Candidatus Limnocylindria bacterium]
MARTILRAGATVWLLAGAAGLGVGSLGAEWLLGILPPLAIGADALARAVGAFSFGLLVVGAAHVVVLRGLRAGARWGHSAGILLAAVLAAALLSVAAAGVTSAVSRPEAAGALIGSGVAALVCAALYTLAAARLVGELRSGPPS